MDIKIVVALIGITGVLVSALVQFYLGRHAEDWKKNIEIRAQAYLDLLNSVSEIAGSAKHSQDRALDQLQKLTQAKTRAILVGSDGVVKAIDKFWIKHGKLDSDEACSSYSSIVSAMRKDLFGKSTISSDLLCSSLFGGKGNA